MKTSENDENTMDALNQEHARRMCASASISEETLGAIVNDARSKLNGDYELIACSSVDVIALVSDPAGSARSPDACVVIYAPDRAPNVGEARAAVCTAACARGLWPSTGLVPHELRALLRVRSIDQIVGTVLLHRSH